MQAVGEAGIRSIFCLLGDFWKLGPWGEIGDLSKLLARNDVASTTVGS
jgi:hypothetical protein